MVESTFQKVDRQACLKIDPAGPAITEAYVVYRSGSGAEQKRLAAVADENGSPCGVRMPVTIDDGGYSVRAEIPKDIPAYFFILTDKNNYQLYSKEAVENAVGKYGGRFGTISWVEK